MKGQGLPIRTIIIAALGILVLVVLGAVFGGQIGKFTRAASECPGRCFLSDSSMQDLRVEAARARVAVSVETLFQPNDCNPEFETRLSGSFLPRNLPKVDDPSRWRCESCCQATG